jgi:glycosyltransferase involved in cell wall biosynthesis
METEADRGSGAIAYIMSRFPKLTETFVLDEILEMERQGESVEIFPLWREYADVVHTDVLGLVERANFLPTINLEILRDLAYWLIRRPNRLFGALFVLISANLSSPRFLAGGLAAFPKACTMARRMSARGVRHVHAHFASHPAAMAFVISRLTDLPYSFTAHGSDLHRDQAMLSQKVRGARFVVAISNYNRRFILERVAEEMAARIKVVHCGVDVRCFGEGNPHSNALNIICIGTLHEVKGQRHLLTACARLENAGVSWSCHLVGDGPDRAELESYARELEISGKVSFHGALPREEVRDLLKTMSVGCAPSVPTANGRREGIPVALIEAGASALPLVASRLSGIPELVIDGETGFLADPADADALAAALLRLSTDCSVREVMGRKARRKVEEEFSLSASVSDLRGFIGGAGLSC